MRLHIISLPHTQTTSAYPSCAFTQKVVRFCAMMRSLGHHVTLYSGAENEADCDEHVECISENKRRKMVGDKHYTEADWGHPFWNGFNARVIEELRKRIEPHDFICLIGGYAHKPIADALDRVDTLDRAAIRDYALSRFSMATVAKQYDAYFRRLSTLWDGGWYEGKTA
jgi:hypothetical protein